MHICECKICGKGFISSAQPTSTDCGSMDNKHMKARKEQLERDEKNRGGKT